jgi:hypothetical protein
VVTARADDDESNSTCDDDNATVNVAADEVLPEVLARTGPQEIQRFMVTGLGLLGLGMMFVYFGEWTRRRSFLPAHIAHPASTPTEPEKAFNPTYGRIDSEEGHRRPLRRRT